MIRRKVNRRDYAEASYLAWNAFIDLIAVEDYEDLNEVQQIAHLIFWYDSEVNNGGHFQYFVNQSGKRAKETLQALSKMNMTCQHKILEEAYQFILQNPLDEILSVDDFIRQANENNFERFDKRFFECSKESNEFLKECLELNFDEFIELV